MMEPVNQKFRVKAIVVSPLSIGQGAEKDWVKGVDYIDRNGWLFGLNMEKMVAAGISIERLSSLFAEGKISEIVDLLGDRLETVCDYKKKMPVRSDNPVKTFYYNPVTRKYSLVGSSLKGAIRSALFHSFTKNDDVKELKERKGKINSSVFGSPEEGTDFMRFIRVGDFDFDATDLVNTKIYNLQKPESSWVGGWKHNFHSTTGRFSETGFNTLYECLMPGAVSEGVILISPLLFNLIHKEQYYGLEKKELMDGYDGSSTATRLFRIINTATKDYLSREIKFFSTYGQAEKSDRILSSLHAYRDMVSAIPEQNPTECVIKMSAGSGFHSITGNWQFRDYTRTGEYPSGFHKGKQMYKSRRIACFGDQLTPMGFLKLQLV